MLASLRAFAGTWPARIFFIVLGVSFAGWGIADVVRNLGGGSGAVARVDGHDITPAQFAAEFQGDWRRIAARFPDPAQMPPTLRQSVAEQTLQKLVTQQALADEVRRMGIAVPDAAVRDAVYAMPGAQGPDGSFSRPALMQLLAANNLTEGRLLDLVRQDVAQHQLLGAVQASASPPAPLTDLVFAYLAEKRRADTVVLPFAGHAPPPAPADAVLQRFQANNAARYTAPEYRHVKVVVLSAETIARGLDLSDADCRAWFAQHRAEFQSPEKRSLQVITTSKAEVAASLAAQWRAGAGWDAMQAAARAAGASATPLDDATRAAVPSPELAQAAFAAPEGSVSAPIREPLGWQVVRVAKITPARHPEFADVADTVRRRLGAERAADLIDARAQKFQDLFAGGAKIDEVPADLGAAAAEGTLDAKGNTLDGNPAPLPATGDLRGQIVAAAFRTNPGDAIETTEGAGHAWYALAVDSITKPAARDFATVRAQVLADWQQDQRRRTQEAAAAKLLALVGSGQTLTQAAWGSGLQVSRTPPLDRRQPPPGIPAELVQRLFTLRPGQATEVETNAGFVVAALAEVIKPDATQAAADYAEAKSGLTKALSDDYFVAYAQALTRQANPQVHPDIVERLIQQGGE